MSITETNTETTTKLTVSGKDFSRALKNSCLFASTDLSRPVLTMIRIEFKADTIKFVATDSYALSMEVLTHDEPVSEERNVLISGDFAKQVGKAFAKSEFVSIEITEDDLIVRDLNQTMQCRLETSQFPDYLPLIPKYTGEVTTIGLGAKLMAKLAKVDDGKKYSGSSTGAPLRFTFIDDLKPVMVKFASTNADITVLIMPVRIADNA